MTESAQAAPGGQETAAATEQQTQEVKAPEQEQPKTYDEAYVADLRKEAAKYRSENKGLKTEIETIRQSSMTETEKAIAEAEARGRSAAGAEFGQRLARSEFDSLAGRRNPDLQSKDIDEILEFTDLSKFVMEDGQPDSKRIRAAVERLVPEASGETRPPSFDSGVRTPPPKPNSMSDLIRRSAGRA